MKLYKRVVATAVAFAAALLSAGSASAALPTSGRCGMLMTFVKPTLMPSWSETIPGLFQQQILNGMGLIDFTARTVTAHFELFGYAATMPNPMPFRRFHRDMISIPFRDVSSQQGVTLGVHTIQFDAPQPNGSTVLVEWLVAPTNGGNTMLVQGGSLGDGETFDTATNAGIAGMSGVCQMT